MQKKNIKGLYFQPWIGDSYETSKYGKLLLLGESHYFASKDDYANDFTSEVVINHIEGTAKSPFFRKLEMLSILKTGEVFGIMYRSQILFKLDY